MLGMNLRLIVAGKPALAYARAGADEYLKRLARHGGCELVTVRAGTRDEVSARLLERSHGCFRVAVDERGEALGTRALAGRLEALALRGDIKTVAFLIGAADGHNDALREASDLVLALSALLTTTMPAMKAAVEAVRAAGLKEVKIMIGGAPISLA